MDSSVIYKFADGKRFDNSSLCTLRQVLRRNYGKVEIVTEEATK